MRALSSLLRRSQPSPLIRRLPLRHVSSRPPPPGAVVAALDDGSPSPLLQWISGAVLGSGLGLLYWHSESGSAAPSVAFADLSAEPAVEESRSSSLYRKFALPLNSPKFIFGETYRRKVFFNYEKRIRLRSPPEKIQHLPNGAVFPKEEDAFGSFPISELHVAKKPGPENVDGSETEDDDEDDEEEADDQDDDAGEEEDGSGEEGEDPEDEPAANGEGGSGDEDEEEDDDNDDDDDDGEDEEEEEDDEDEDEEEELPQPPAKKRK